MAKTQKVRLIVAATAFVALALPRSSSAQFLPPSLGTWTGYDTYKIFTTNASTGQLISSYSGSGPATLSIGTDTMTIEGDFPFPIIGVGSSSRFGPTSASGSISFNGGPGGSAVGNFFVTYESILPNGQIDVGNGSAVADLTTGVLDDFDGPISTWTVIHSFATFTTVPEPSSGVLAGLAILVIAAVAWMRGFRSLGCGRYS
jgi:PEP-CTERM motif